MNKKKMIAERYSEIIMVVILLLYPLRHVHVGLDLWDTGYNYSNFLFMGYDSMDPMWLFSTYLATAFGHVLSLLPGGSTLLGMNFYTSMVISVTALISYLFCTRKLKFASIPVFIGEMIALSLCWCPSAVLYNYLTYLFMTVAICLLYIGLTKKKKRMLFYAGILLGLNVFVRFSNLPEMAFILAVWAYAHLEIVGRVKGEDAQVRKRERIESFKRTVVRTLLCIAGYASAIVGMLGFFAIRYGIGDYWNAIKRLFAMTDDASAYKPTSMITSLIYEYIDRSYWTIRILLVLLLGILICMGGKLLDVHLGLGVNTITINKNKKFSFLKLSYVITVLLGVALVAWLIYTKNFASNRPDEYSSIINPATVFLMFIIITSVVMIILPRCTIEEKLISGLVLLTIMVTPIGSNNVLFPAYNNLFIAAPYMVWNFWQLLKLKEWPGLSRDGIKKYISDKKRTIYSMEEKPGFFKKLEMWIKNIAYVIKREYSVFAVKAIISIVSVFLLVHFFAFGFAFTFTEGQGARDVKYAVSEIPALKGIRMEYQKAKDIYELYSFMEVSELFDRELITYGNIPAITFYFGMAPAFNSWADLKSYNYQYMVQDLNKAALEYNAGDKAYPVIISLSGYYEDGATITDEKYILIQEFMERNEYRAVYSNDKYIVFATEKG